MAKMRGIKPEFFTDEDIVELTISARLLFVGLWTLACDNGHTQDRPRQIKMRLFPADEIDVDVLLNELLKLGLIEREAGYVKVVNLSRHQRIDRRYLSLCDRCAHDVHTTFSEADRPVRPSGTRSAHAVHTSGTRRVHDDEGEGEGEKKVKVRGDESSSRKRAVQIPEDWTPNDKHAEFARTNRLNLDAETAQFRDHHTAKGSTMKDWDAAFRTWLRNAVKFGGAKTLTPIGAPDPNAWMTGQFNAWGSEAGQ